MGAGKTVSILVVEDHGDTLRLYLRILKSAGYEAVGAVTIAEANRLCAERTFDVAVSDIDLPDGDGRELLAELARRCGTRGIVVSGLAAECDRAGTSALGVGVFLTKPIIPGALLDAIGAAVLPVHSPSTPALMIRPPQP